MFSGVPTQIQGRLDPSSVIGGGTLTPSGTVIVTGGVFNLGNTTVAGKDGRKFNDSDLSFEVILPGSNSNAGTEVNISGVNNEKQIESLKNEEKNLQDSLTNLSTKIATVDRERIELETQFNQLAMQKSVLETENRSLEARLQQLNLQKNSVENQKQALEKLIASFKKQQDDRNFQVASLKSKSSNLENTKSAYLEQNASLKERESKLVEAINQLVNDQSLENEIAALESDAAKFSRAIDNVQEIALFANKLRKSVLDLQKGNIVYRFAPLPSGLSVSTTPATEEVIVKFDPLSYLFSRVTKPLTASNIADWITGTSQAIADAKLQISTQKANAAKQLSQQLRITRAAIKQNESNITDLASNIQQVQTETVTAESELTTVKGEIQKYESQLENINSQIAGLDANIQQTQAAIEQNQGQIAQNDKQIQQTQDNLGEKQQKISQEQQKAQQRLQQMRNTFKTDRPEPLVSNIFPARSMRQ
jgi:chromosome segregation ATPase